MACWLQAECRKKAVGKAYYKFLSSTNSHRHYSSKAIFTLLTSWCAYHDNFIRVVNGQYGVFQNVILVVVLGLAYPSPLLLRDTYDHPSRGLILIAPVL